MDALKRLWIILSLVFTTLVYAQEDAVLWSPEVKLKWSDFKGLPEQNSRIAAATASGISYEFSSLERDGYYEVEYTVDTYFYPDKSWYQPHMCDELILSHEQLHFDISELFARKMRKKMESTRFTNNVKAEVKAIYHQTIRELAAFQDLYDQETNFSRDRKVQLSWNQEIRQALGK